MTGKTLGHYRVGEQLGRGGMGEVYAADDLNLNRKVALKFLPDAFTGDPERMARFEREAKLLASLNHPNIAVIYGLEDVDGKRFLVLELVEGETLAQRLSKGALPPEEVLAICLKIAEGLEAAHEKGVIHRDLKPANVMITAEEKVKILDFGLAKALSDETQSIDSSQSPTLTEAMTRPGIILGTAAYMSPEQAKGKSVDRRADIWAFGCILYECLTGKRAFEGETVTETLAAILRGEPDWQSVPGTISPNLLFVLRGCLEKSLDSRFHCVADLRILIEKPPYVGEAKQPVKASRPWISWSIAALAVLIAIVSASRIFQKESTGSPELVRFQISLPDQMSLGMMGTFALSPDGSRLAFAGIDSGGVSRLWLRNLDSLDAHSLPGTESGSIAQQLFWSPDSRFIAFDAGGKLKKIDVTGGPALPICDLSGSMVGGSWNRDGVIIFADFTGSKAIMRVSAAGGIAAPVTRLDPKRREIRHEYPIFLPDGRCFLYFCNSGAPENTGVFIGSLDSKPEEQPSSRLIAASGPALYVSSEDSRPGQLLFLHGQTLVAQRFDEKRLELSGDLEPVVEPVGSLFEFGFFSVSTNGFLVYRPRIENRLTWIDRAGRELGTIWEPGNYPTFDLSEDGSQLVVAKVQADGHQNLWTMDLLHDSPTRLTLENADHVDPRWSPDNRQVIFGSTSDSSRSPFQVSVSDRKSTQVFKYDGKMFSLDDWSPDGRYLLYHDSEQPRLWARPLLGEGTPQLVTRELSGMIDQAQFSPDGHWIAYNTDESGRFEVKVAPFPPTGDKWPVSTAGGAQPRWGKNGQELYFLAPDATLMVVDIHAGKTFEWGKARPLFPTRLYVNYVMEQYVPAPDGSRFLFVKPAAGDSRSPFSVVLNWTSLLKK